jgi:hypothetical protein
MTKTATTAKAADLLELAVSNTVSEFGLNIGNYADFYCVWTSRQKGVAKTRDGFEYLQEGVIVFLDDIEIVIRQVADNALNAGEIRLTGFATRDLELIQGAIESALVF